MFLRKDNNPFTRDAALCRLMSGKSVTVVIMGEQCPCTNGKIIAIPPLPIDADEVDRDIHDHSIAHEPAHITEGSFDGVSLKGISKLLHDIWNFIEDARAEDSQERTKYRGLRVWRAGFYGHFDKYATRIGTNKMLTADTHVGAVRGALCLLFLYARGFQLGVNVNVATSNAVALFYSRVLKKYQDRVLALTSSAEALALAGDIYKEITGVVAKYVQENDESPIIQGGGGSNPPDPFGGVSNPPDTGILHELEQGTESITQQIKSITQTNASVKYTPRELTNRRPTHNESLRGQVNRLKEMGIKLLGSGGMNMTRLFVANSRPRTVYGRIDGRLDTRAVTADHLDVRREVYSHRIRGAVDRAAVSFLYDISGSMRGQLSMVVQIIMGLCHYLDKARIPFDIHAFSTSYWTMKEWDEPWAGKAQLNMYPMDEDSTWVAYPMKMVARGLMGRPEFKKILIVLSDGTPDDYAERGYCHELTKTLRASGVVVIGIGINVDLSYMFGESIILPADATMGDFLVRRTTEILSVKTPVK